MKNKMIRTSVSLMLVPLFTFLVSCNEKLDLKPSQSIDADVALTTPQRIKATMVGAYFNARSANLFGSQFNEFSELLATTGDMIFLGTYLQPRDFEDKEIAITNSYVENTWIDAYKLINICNILVEDGTLAILDEADRDRIKGEALFLRGWVLFEMTRFFGLPYEAGQSNDQPGVPIILTASKAVSDALPVARNTVSQCYAQVLSDLTQARDLLPEDNGVYANTFAARAILARVYLQMSDFPNAAAEASYVIENGSYTLTPSPLRAFNNTTNSFEDILALQNNVSSNTSWLTVMYASLNGAGRGDYDIQPSFIERFDPQDERGFVQEDTDPSYTIDDITMMYYRGVGTILNNGGINTAKWGNYYRNIPLIRLAEMYLIRAEANFEDPGTDVGPNTPTEDINVVRARANAPLYMTDVSREEIREERYLELCWEGHRLHDLKRWKMDIGSYAYDAGNLILPIPFREMEVNDLLEQNEWYTSGK